MSTPKLLDLFCGGGGAAMGYNRADFEVVGVDIAPQKHYPFEFHQADALEFLVEHGREYDAIHASPPCQGYSIMNNLPWLRGREYPLLILPVMEMLKAIGKPYIVENVMGARRGAKGLTKKGLEKHGLEAGWLCGGMFGKPFYRHRLFATSWFWLQPGHPNHRGVIRQGRNLGEREHAIVFSNAEDSRGIESWPNRRPYNKGLSGMLSLTSPNADIHQSFSVRAASPTLAQWQNGLHEGIGIGHAKGWKLAAVTMDIDWMTRDELTQAIPPVYTEYIGKQLLKQLEKL